LVLTTCGKNNMQIIIVSKLYNKVWYKIWRGIIWRK
jgi:hypothetical protein